MARPGYRDEPEDIPFTEEEMKLMQWTQAWRVRFHEYEEAIYRSREGRIGMVEGLTTRDVATEYRFD